MNPTIRSSQARIMRARSAPRLVAIVDRVNQVAIFEILYSSNFSTAVYIIATLGTVVVIE